MTFACHCEQVRLPPVHVDLPSRYQTLQWVIGFGVSLWRAAKRQLCRLSTKLVPVFLSETRVSRPALWRTLSLAMLIYIMHVYAHTYLPTTLFLMEVFLMGPLCLKLHPWGALESISLLTPSGSPWPYLSLFGWYHGFNLSSAHMSWTFLWGITTLLKTWVQVKSYSLQKTP